MALSVIEQHHLALIFGVLGNIVSFMVLLAPAPTFYKIWKSKSIDGYSSLPYLVALLSCVIWLYYGLVRSDGLLLITINSIGCCMEIIYIAIFLFYATHQARSSTIKLFVAMSMGFAMIFFITYFAMRGSLRIHILGWTCVAISTSVFAAPLSTMAQVIRTRSVQYMPISLSVFLTLGAVMWFAYGFFRNDICIIIPNVLGFLLGIVQMVLYCIYRDVGGR